MWGFMHIYTCKVCENEFKRTWKDKKRPDPKYCSRSCYSKADEKKYETLIGQKFGKLVVLKTSKTRSKKGHICLICKCDCGNEKDIPVHHLQWGDLISCGCWKSGEERKKPTFLKKIEKTNGCWIWKGMISKSGYARHVGKYAHRLSFEYHKEKIPEGKMICHTCNNKACVNPDHMYAGTAYDNAQDAIRDGALKKRSLTSRRHKK